MLKIKNLRGECQHCGGTIEFHAEHVGASAECPHCGQQTELLLAAPPEEASPVRKKAIVFTVCAILILGGGLLAANIALKRARRLQAERQNAAPPITKPTLPPDPFTTQSFQVSPVKLDKGMATSIVYAVGSILNTTNRQRFGVRVEIDLFDDTGSKVGVASDYQKVMEPNAEWRFRAMVMEKRASTAKVAAIKEAQ